MKTRFSIIIGIVLFSTFTNEVYAVCAAETLEWWEPCNDTGMFSDGIYIKYTVLIPIVIVAILILGFLLLIYRRKRK